MFLLLVEMKSVINIILNINFCIIECKLVVCGFFDNFVDGFGKLCIIF